MATFNTAFGSLPGTSEMMGTTNTTGGGQQTTQNQTQQTTASQTGSPQQTFAQLQKQGMARPAPAAPQAQAFQQYGGSQQGQQMRQQLQQQLQQFNQAPSRFDTQAFQQIRGAQAANIQSDFAEQQRQLNEDLARRGLSASNIAGSGLARLGGAQSRALADLDAQLLQRAAETQAQDRAQLLQAGQGFAELAGSQDLSQFEANRVAQAATFENDLRAAQFGQQQYEQGTQQALQAAQAEQGSQQFGSDLTLRLGELTGQVGGTQTLGGAQQAEQQRQFNIQQALQQQLGTGNLSLEQQRLAQQGSQFSQQIQQAASQFGLSLNEQQAARLQQYGISTQELGLETQRVQNQASQFGQQLSSQNAQNTAQNNLEQARINEAIASRTTGVSESALERGLRQTLQTQQVSEQGRQFNLEQSLRNAIAQTEATGFAYQPLTTGTGVGALGGMTSTLARTAQEAAQSQATLDLNLRRQLGLSELSGRLYDAGGTTMGSAETVGSRSATSQDQLARNQLFMQLAQALGSLSPTQIQNIVRTGTTNTGGGTDGTDNSI
jgi:hypothetical protein